MNLEDLLDENGLQQDEWSLTAPTFGKEGQLQVIGWARKNSQNNKYYILKCIKCSKDYELFGDGYFKSLKGSLITGRVPCGCALNPRWSKEQHFIRCSRKAEELNYLFLGFHGKWLARKTKISMMCSDHGIWNTGDISNLNIGNNGCPTCALENISKLNSKTDDVMIASFFASGAFHPDSKFWRSARLTKSGYRQYWYMSCPECEEIADSTSTDLQRGHRPCLCSKNRQKEAYINLLVDDNNNTVSIKFGVAVDSKERTKKQNRASTYDVQQYSVYAFTSVQSCRKAERECKQQLECGVVLKRDMPDGYTETTWAYNLEKIIEIYERNGGIRKINP